MREDQQDIAHLVPTLQPSGAFSLGTLGVSATRVPGLSARVRFQNDRQEVHCLIREVYRRSFSIEQIEAALLKSGTGPQAIYHDLSAGYETARLASFTEALGLPRGALVCWTREETEMLSESFNQETLLTELSRHGRASIVVQQKKVQQSET